MDLERKYTRLVRVYKDSLVTKKLQSKRIEECDQTIQELHHTIEQLRDTIMKKDLEIQTKDQKLRNATEQFNQLNDQVKQHHETIADLKEFVARRIGIDALDALDRGVHNIDQLLENVDHDDDDETTDGGSDLAIPFFNENLPIDKADQHNQQNRHSEHSLEFLENIPPSSPFRHQTATPPQPLESLLHCSSPVYHASPAHHSNSLHHASPLREVSPVPHEQPYVEAVRKKDERKKLIGTACKCCVDYYYAAGNLPGPDGRIITPEERIQECSRHRTRFKRPKTPPGFWNLDFISTQDVEGQYTKR